MLPAKRREKSRPDSRPSSSSKKIIAYALIGILALGAVSVVAFAPRPLVVDPAEESRRQAVLQFQERFCGLGEDAKSTEFVTEYTPPGNCGMPLAIESDGDLVWYVSTKNGTLGTYDVAQGRFGEEYQVPSWPARTNPTTFSMSWSAKADGQGNLWFTDDQQGALWKFNTSSRTFSMFPISARLPVSLDFDSQDNIYFVGVQSTSLFVGDTSAMTEGTSNGIAEIPLPLDGFAGIANNLITSGALAVDRQNNDIWISLLSFQNKGQLLQYDIDAGNVTNVVDLPADLTSPVGLVLDDMGDLWVTDHGTSVFFRYDKESGEITKFVTSVASPRIYAGRDLPNAYTLPYWIEKSPDSSLLWFNQHTGNKIASFDPESLVLTEYWVPSQNRNWITCPDNSDVSCGLANALQISSGTGGQLWFTEWTENKIGRVDGSKPIPVSVSVQDGEVTVRRGDSAEIRMTIQSDSNFEGSMIAASTLTSNGRLANSTGIFSEHSISLGAGSSKQISFTFTPTDDLMPGKYTLMLGVGSDDVSTLKAVALNVV